MKKDCYISMIGLVDKKSMVENEDCLTFTLAGQTLQLHCNDELKELVVRDLNSRPTLKGMFKGIFTESIEPFKNIRRTVKKLEVTEYKVL